MKPLVQIIAHRGYSSAFPDNSLEGFEQAWKFGADMIETDIRAAMDGSLICSHDAGDPKALPFNAALDFAKGKIRLLLDLKLNTPEFHAALKKTLLDHQMENEIIIGVRSLEQACAMRSELPRCLMLGFLKNPGEFPEFYRAGGNIGRLWEDDLNDRNLEMTRTGNHPVFIMAGCRGSSTGVGDITRERLRKLMKFDIQGILVNDPVLALQVRSEKPQDAGEA